MFLGFALAAIGMDNVTGQLRLTFGLEPLIKGFDFLIAVIGLFGIGEILLTMEEGLAFRGKTAKITPCRVGNVEDAAQILEVLPAQLICRLLDGRDAGRRNTRLVHGLRHRQAVLAE